MADVRKWTQVVQAAILQDLRVYRVYMLQSCGANRNLVVAISRASEIGRLSIAFDSYASTLAKLPILGA